MYAKLLQGWQTKYQEEKDYLLLIQKYAGFVMLK